MATIPATTAKTGGAGHRIHRARRHVARDERRERHADRPRAATTAAISCLPDDPAAVLRLADNPALAQQIGHDIVTASGTTLLGADDKAGVAEIVTAAEYLWRIPRSRTASSGSRSRRTKRSDAARTHFDVARFGCRCAYTLDGGSRGEVESESFSADAMTLAFHGFNTHPGYAKGRMVNAIKVAADFIHRLPADRLSPETTDGLRGLRASVRPAVGRRSHVRQADRPRLRAPKAWRRRKRSSNGWRAKRPARHPGARVEIAIEEQYRNMRDVLDRHPEVVEYAREAVRRAGLDGPGHAHPRRHRRIAAVVHGPADAESLRRRAQLPLAARVGLAAGHGESRRRHRRLCRVWEERAPV